MKIKSKKIEDAVIREIKQITPNNALTEAKKIIDKFNFKPDKDISIEVNNDLIIYITKSGVCYTQSTMKFTFTFPAKGEKLKLFNDEE